MISRILRADQVISNGAMYNLKAGEVIKYDSLPNQPVAAIFYNKTGNTTTVFADYLSSTSIRLDAEQGGAFGNGYWYEFNPAETNANEINFRLSATSQPEANVDVYLVSLYFPAGIDTGINNQELPLNGSPVSLDGFSRAYCTPTFAEYEMVIRASDTGFITLGFHDDVIEIYGVNLAPDTQLRKYVILDNGGMNPAKVHFNLPESGNTYTKLFYGLQSQYVFTPIIAADAKDAGSIAIQQVG